MKKVNLITLVLLALPAIAFGAGVPDDNAGWWFSERFVGTSNTAGLVLKSNSTVGYRFNDHVQTYAGLPVYFTRQAPANGNSGSTFVNGIGNAFTGLLISAKGESLHYSSELVLTAPTGDQSRGFSTGHVTGDWTNTFSHPFATFTPYGSVGLANTISDTEFFVRPFTTKGAVAHVEGGSLFRLTSHLNAGASAYAVRAAGTQEIVSKVVDVPATQTTSSATTTSQTTSQKNGVLSTVTNAVGLTNGNGNGNGSVNKTIFETTHETVTTADAVDDHGFSTWLAFRVNSMTDFQFGYSRSVSYQFNSLFFGIGFRAGH